ncbi:hypothetical protein HOK51_09370 [Candidatus Woesearchaeota archaeon]|jgi:hypothetical protein|nr:hypothetical protein [Candidatus Woesearchaeota archaeon]MBT6520038.1 hypothetical protein [Candidatus Woesearchaeota archaeon]MBT7368621.1 hypothetical protein [Candidatus Woesearchaeota archaeon]
MSDRDEPKGFKVRDRRHHAVEDAVDKVEDKKRVLKKEAANMIIKNMELAYVHAVTDTLKSNSKFEEKVRVIAHDDELTKEYLETVEKKLRHEKGHLLNALKILEMEHPRHDLKNLVDHLMPVLKQIFAHLKEQNQEIPPVGYHQMWEHLEQVVVQTLQAIIARDSVVFE